MQAVSIDFFKNGLKKYGELERIEVFSDDHSHKKFTHVTFKQGQAAYCALLDCNGNLESNRMIEIRPADMHLQPDSSVDSSESPFDKLNDGCLLAIFNFCNIHTCAMLSTVCKRMCTLLATRVFAATPEFNLVATNGAEVGNALLTVSRLVQCLNPSGFHVKFFRNLRNSVKWPTIVLGVGSSKTHISTDMDFFKSEWLDQLRKIGKRIKSIRLHLSINDKSEFDPFSGDTFPNATELTIAGYSIRCDIPDLSSVASSLPKLEAISLRDGTVSWDHVISYCEHANCLQSIGFQNCCFDSSMDGGQIRQIARVIRTGSAIDSRLGLSFDRIQINTSNECASGCGSEFDSCSCVSESRIDPTEISTYDSIKEVLNFESILEFMPKYQFTSFVQYLGLAR